MQAKRHWKLKNTGSVHGISCLLLLPLIHCWQRAISRKLENSFDRWIVRFGPSMANVRWLCFIHGIERCKEKEMRDGKP
jgi:hypothetical protein